MGLTLSAISSRLHVFSALRYRHFRLYWFGHLISVSGYQMVILANGWLIWTLTGSEALLGALGLVIAAPAILLTLFGGVVADKVELRRLLIVLQSVIAVALFALATLVVTGLVQVWHLFVLGFTFGVVEAFDIPGRHALFPHLLDRRHLLNAVSLNSTIWPGTRIFGPAIAGLLIDWVGAAADSPLIGAGAVYYLASLAFALFGLFLFQVTVPSIERSSGRNLLRDIGDGLSFLWTHRVFTFLIGMNFMNIFFVVSHVTLMPVFASDVFKGDASTLGTLFAASGIGSLVGALTAANLGNFRRRGWLIIGGSAAQAVFVMLFALSGSYSFALIVLPLAGMGFSIFMVCAQSTVQLLVPDEFRGRLMAIWGMNYGVVFPLGQLQIGAVASLSRTYLSGVIGSYAGAPSAVILGAAIMLAFTVMGAGTNRQIRELGPQSVRE